MCAVKNLSHRVIYATLWACILGVGGVRAHGTAEATPASLCSQLGGSWNAGERFCGKVVSNPNGTKLVVEARYSTELTETGVTATSLQKYLYEFMERFSRSDDNPSAKDGGASLRFRLFHHSPAVTSVLYSNIYFTGSAQFPKEELTSFTYDTAKGKQIVLTEIFQKGQASLLDLAERLRPTIQEQLSSVNNYLSQHNRDVISLDSFNPGASMNPHGYPVFTLSEQELTVYLPPTRDGQPGTVIIEAHVPLKDIKDLLRPEYQ